MRCHRVLSFLCTIILGGVLNFSCKAQRAEQAYSRLHHDSGITFPSYAIIQSELSSVVNDFPLLAKQEIYGKSKNGVDLTAIRIQDTSIPMVATPAGILVTEAIHGNEYLNIANRLPRSLLTDMSPGLQTFLSSGGILIIVPVVNPDGFTARIRNNGNNIDLNRDYTLVKANKNAGFTQPEVKSLDDFIRKEIAAGMVLKLTFEYHCCAGALLRPWAYTRDPLNDMELERFNTVGSIMTQHLKYPLTPVFQKMGYSALGTSQDYYYETFGTMAYTFEGQKLTEKSNFAGHLLMWDQIFAKVAEPTFSDSPIQPSVDPVAN